MEGFDIRTLSLTSLLLGLFLGFGSILFARIHHSFVGFKQLGMSYFVFSFGYILISLRLHIPEFYSIIIANLVIVFAFRLLILAILHFFKWPDYFFKQISNISLIAVLISFPFFTYIEPHTNIRIVIVSVIIGVQSFYISFKILNFKANKINEKQLKDDIKMFMIFLGGAFSFCGLIMFVRVNVSLMEPLLVDFMEAGTVHGISFMAIQLISICSCFTLSLTASQQMAHKLEIQATVDSLTDVYNRRAFDEFAEKEVLRAQREHNPLAVILMDIDLFKQVNDNYGHQVGDKVLQEFSLRLKNSLRQYDILARYGGEEFTLLLPSTDINTALVIAEKLRFSIAQPMFYLEGVELLVTASFGVAVNQGEFIDWQQLIAFADNALYQAKDSGRNCVKLHVAEVHNMTHIEQRS
jgi:diguanylate cyclase (GGDEF)-like protein